MCLLLGLMFALSSIQIIPARSKRDTEDQNETELKTFGCSEGESSSPRWPDDSFSPK